MSISRSGKAQHMSHAQRKIAPLIPSLLVVALVLSQTACAPLYSAFAGSSAPKSLVEIQAEVNTAVAATMISFYVAETQSAAKLASSPIVPTNAPPTPTPTTAPTEPVPTAIPALPTTAPSPTALPAPVIVTLVPPAAPASSSLPTIWAEIDTNCRYGPSINYGVDGYLMIGMSSYVYGSDTGQDWWYIENPQKKGHYCWVWAETTHVDGNVSAVPVVAVAPQPAPATYPWYGYGYNYGYYPNGCGYSYNCYCPCQVTKLNCSQRKKWCIPVVVCKCKKVCYYSCYKYPCYTPYTQVNWNRCPSTGCSSSWCRNNPGACGW